MVEHTHFVSLDILMTGLVDKGSGEWVKYVVFPEHPSPVSIKCAAASALAMWIQSDFSC